MNFPRYVEGNALASWTWTETDTVSNSPTLYQIPPSHFSVAISSSATHTGSSKLADGHFKHPTDRECRQVRKKRKMRGQPTLQHGTRDRATTSRVTIDMLPDIALLELFDFYVNKAGRIEKWHTLIHVCRRWRNVVLGSPRRLGLQLFCTARKPVRETLDVWPPFPIIIRHGHYQMLDMDNIVAALKQADRVCEIRLWPVPNSQWENVMEAMRRQSFPELTDLRLKLQPKDEDESAQIVPDSFLCGFVPRLRTLRLECVPFPGLPKLILSAPGLVKISLQKFPRSGYISPNEMVACLSTLTNLAELELSLMSPPSRPNRESRRSPLFTRSVLPALRHLVFVGVSEYLEDLVACIDSPLLDSLQIKLFNQLIFNTPQLTQFISRSPMLKAREEARIDISYSGASVIIPGVFGKGLRLEISCRQSDWQLLSLKQVCYSSFPRALISSLEHLHIGNEGYS